MDPKNPPRYIKVKGHTYRLAILDNMGRPEERVDDILAEATRLRQLVLKLPAEDRSVSDVAYCANLLALLPQVLSRYVEAIATYPDGRSEYVEQHVRKDLVKFGDALSELWEKYN